ncbi:hypothetical protein ACFL3D_07015 [Candidatus Omnitrophota bacterium]
MMNPCRNTTAYVVVLGIFISGCASLTSQTAPVAFEDPHVHLGIQEVEPTAQEDAGIVLRYQYPEKGVRTYEEEMVLFNGISGDTGKKTTLTKTHTDIYLPGTQKDTSLITSETVFLGEKEKIYTTTEVDNRGAILSLHEGRHKTPVGLFTVTEWKRSSVFPQEAVRIGDTWTYEETMALAIKSWFVKDLDNTPLTVRARNTLKGFALLKGRRCAVIETVALENRPYRFKILFLTIAITMATRIDDTLYFDYATGEEIARITKAHSQTMHEDGRMLDELRMQGVTVRGQE